MEKSDVLVRLRAEKLELSQRLEKLEVFLNSKEFLKIDPEQQGLLVVQLSAMQTYNACIYMRIRAMERKHK